MTTNYKCNCYSAKIYRPILHLLINNHYSLCKQFMQFNHEH